MSISEPGKLRAGRADFLIGANETILVTGAAGFIGTRVVKTLVDAGFQKVRCLVRPSSDVQKLERVASEAIKDGRVEIFAGNLLSRADCEAMARNVAVVYHLAAGTGSKSFADAFMNSVVTTRNLLDALVHEKAVKRFVNLSSFAVYSNVGNPRPGILDENGPVESHPQSRAEAYCYAKVKQDQIVIDYGRKHGLLYVLLRPGVVYGPGKNRIPGRVGTDSLGIFLNFGGSGLLPLTYVDNCADAVVLAGLKQGIEGEVFNIVDDDLPSSSQFLGKYKRQVKRVRSLYVPRPLSYLFCYAWEKYAAYSREQIPAVFSRREWDAYWKPTGYPNTKLKTRLGWHPRISTSQGLEMFFESCRSNGHS